MKKILAKPSQSLIGHVRDVLSALEMLRTTSFSRFVEVIRIPIIHAPMLYDVCRMALLCHDIGKANWWFQELISGKDIKQKYRHEHISGYIIHRYLHDSIVKWFNNKYSSHGELAYQLIFYSVVHHHGKIAVEKGVGEPLFEFCVGNAMSSVPEPIELGEFYGDSDDINWIISELNIGCNPLPNLSLSKELDTENLDDIRDDYFDLYSDDDTTLEKFIAADEKMFGSRYTGRLALLCKVILIFCDGLGSCEHRVTGKNVTQMVMDGLSTTCKSELDAVLNSTKNKIELSGKRFEFTGAQQWVIDNASKNPRLISIGDAGSGKTLQHYLFASNQQHVSQYLVVLLPTMGVTAASFEQSGLGINSKLMFSNANAALDELTTKMNERGDENVIDKNDYLLDAELRAFSAYTTKIIYATYDQFFSALVGSYNGILLLPLLWSSTIIVDEPHSVDARLYSALTTFFRVFNIKTLFTSASMPMNRLDKLSEIGFNILQPSTRPEPVFDIDRVQSHIKRYQIMHGGVIDECFKSIMDDFNSGIKIGIIFNRSESASRFYKIVMEYLGRDASVVYDDVLCYHGKMVSGEKTKRHQNVMDASRSKDIKRFMVITTQIAEMALDIKLKIYTEECPLWAFIQRIGRGETRGKISIDAAPTKVTVFSVIGSSLVNYNQSERDIVLPYNLADIKYFMKVLRFKQGERVYRLWSQSDFAKIMNRTYSSQDNDVPNGTLINYCSVGEVASTTKTSLRLAAGLVGVLPQYLDTYKQAIINGDIVTKTACEITLDIHNENGKIKKGILEPIISTVNGKYIRCFQFEPDAWEYRESFGFCRVFDAKTALLSMKLSM